MTSMPPTSRRNIPSLDGLRAISILFVVIGHAAATLPNAGPVARRVLWLLGDAGLGVSIFFVISGYLISRLLLAERDRTGSISLKSFYFRRLLRIFPAYYFFLGCMVVLAKLGLVQIPFMAFVNAFGFVWNYSVWGPGGWWLGHSWSLSVEEQFYLLWPLTLLLAGPKRGLKIVVGIIVLSPFVRVATYFVAPSLRGFIAVMLHTRVDMIMYGCLLALAERSERIVGYLRRCVAWRLPQLAIAFLVLSHFLSERFRGSYDLPFGWSLVGVSAALVIFWVTNAPTTVVGMLLNTRPMVHIGKLSYSLYLWQQLFLTPLNTTFSGSFPANLAFALLAAHISYYGVEMTFLRFRDRARRAPDPCEVAAVIVVPK